MSPFLFWKSWSPVRCTFKTDRTAFANGERKGNTRRERNLARQGSKRKIYMAFLNYICQLPIPQTLDGSFCDGRIGRIQYGLYLCRCPLDHFWPLTLLASALGVVLGFWILWRGFTSMQSIALRRTRPTLKHRESCIVSSRCILCLASCASWMCM